MRSSENQGDDDPGGWRHLELMQDRNFELGNPGILAEAGRDGAVC